MELVSVPDYFVNPEALEPGLSDFDFAPITWSVTNASFYFRTFIGLSLEYSRMQRGEV